MNQAILTGFYLGLSSIHGADAARNVRLIQNQHAFMEQIEAVKSANPDQPLKASDVAMVPRSAPHQLMTQIPRTESYPDRALVGLTVLNSAALLSKRLPIVAGALGYHAFYYSLVGQLTTPRGEQKSIKNSMLYAMGSGMSRAEASNMREQFESASAENAPEPSSVYVAVVTLATIAGGVMVAHRPGAVMNAIGAQWLKGTSVRNAFHTFSAAAIPATALAQIYSKAALDGFRHDHKEVMDEVSWRDKSSVSSECGSFL